MNQLKLRTRMALVFSALGALVLTIASLGAWEIVSQHEDAARLTESAKTQQLLAEWRRLTSTNLTRTVAIVRSTDAKLADEFAPAMKEASARISALQKELDQVAFNDAERKMLSSIAEVRSGYIAAREETLKLKKTADSTAVMALYESRFAPAISKYESTMVQFIDSYTQRRVDEQAASEAASRQMLTVIAITSAIGLLLAGMIAVWLVRSILRQLGGDPAYAVDVANRIANGDLSVEVEVSPDDKGSLLAAIKRMERELKDIVVGIKTASHTITSATDEIASGNAHLSQRTEEQAAALEETASSMDELTTTVRQNAEHATQANQLAAGASTMAVKGSEIVSKVVSNMSSISESSSKIADIIGIIDGIAFQTNILALNAAVEAARAGEQGRGFAVVAAEVRTLAQRSAVAAKDIKVLISDSVSRVEDGKRFVNEAGQTMEEIVGSIKRVTGIMAGIAAASQEQSSGIDQVNQALVQIDQVTQQNAALVEEAAAAAESMQQQSQSLTNAVSMFKLSNPSALESRGERQVAAAVVRGRAPARLKAA